MDEEMIRNLLHRCTGFDWDAANIDKNREKHLVEPHEAEEVFAATPLKLSFDFKHSQTEKRFVAFGKSAVGRKLLVIWTIRNWKVRPISARDMHEKERKFYEQFS